MINDFAYNIYHQNLKRYTKEHKSLKKYSIWLSVFRILFFLMFIFFLIELVNNPDFLNIILIFVSFISFIISVKKSTKTSEKIGFINNLILINSNELRALNHDFSIFDGGADFNDLSHPYSSDLDIFGEESIFSQVNRTTSYFGKNQLAQWFNTPLLKKSKIIQRQEAVKELTFMYDLRQSFMALSSDSNEHQNRKNILSWIHHTLSHKEFYLLRFIALTFVIISIASIILVFLKLLPFNLLVLILFINALLIFSKLKKINNEHSRLSKQFNHIAQIADKIDMIDKQEFNSSYLRDLQNKIKGDEKKGIDALKKLAKLINYFDYRLNIFISIVLNGFFLWDFFCLIRLHKWKRNFSKSIHEWFLVIDEFDALQSIANFSFNNPDYTFAEITDHNIIIAKNIGHPQIEPGKRICNHFSIKQSGEFHIITGPNMAGKSTFLRTIGCAIILAQIGAPVCAEEFILKPVNLYTGMRTTDSLNKNESYFMAELIRLKKIMNKTREDFPVFIILDEILKGTNSKDKEEGSKQYIKRVSELNASGIIATHDISLAELEKEFPEKIQNFCFEAENTGDILFYSYKLKKGITTRMNATILMKQMGII